ncbi:MAG: hypothetical protein JNM22_07035 [Saprospiraceae bacterium]|nr:hypothetical protein [Saprospiraceae bacterium]
MKTFAKYLFLLAPLLLSGCFDILEELWLNKDQSGRYELSVTMGAGPMANMIQAAQKKSNDSLIALGLPPRPMDTVIYLRNLPDSIQKMLPYPDVVNTLEIHLKMEKGIKFHFQYPFSHLDSLHHFWETLTAIEEIQKDSVIKKSKVLDFPEMANLQQILGGTPVMHWKGKTLQRTVETEDNGGVELMGEMFEDSDNPMVKMMMRNRTYELKFHLPKKVKRVSTDGYMKEGKDVHARFPLIEVMKDRSKLECAIKMK